jgi:hypothetical protein
MTIDTGATESTADVVERMFAIFEKHLSLATIVRVVRRCRRELDIAAGPSLAELAHDRLTGLAHGSSLRR